MGRSTTRLRPRSAAAVAALLICVAAPLPAQTAPPGPVRFTEAREQEVQGTVHLPGSVESRIMSVVASEVAGLVDALRVREGDRVRKGRVLARLRTSSLELRRDASAAQLKEAEARLKLAERSLERARGLSESGVLSQQQLDDAFYEYTAWQGRVEQLTVEIARIDLDLERCDIRAPFTGVVVAERTDVGEWIDVGGPVVEMVSLDNLEVRVEVPERYFRSLRPGVEARVTFESIPGVSLTGRVNAIIPRADPQARTFPLRVLIQDRDGDIGVGMLAQVALPSGESYRATLVPKDAVVGEGADQHVFLIDGASTVTRVPIRTGAGYGDWVVVEGALHAGQKVVTRGNERLQPGQAVQGELLEYDLQ
jgi:RND family efflux transporter MFP subunit